MGEILKGFRPVSLETIPLKAVELFEERTDVDPVKRLGLQAFRNLWVYQDDRPIATYIGLYDKSLDEDGIGPFDDTLVHAIDVSREELAGETLARLRHTEGDAIYTGRPTVDWTQTHEQHLR